MKDGRVSYGIQEWILVFLLAAIWGSSFILMKRGLEVFPPEQVAALRLFSAFVFLSPIVLLNIRKVDPSKWKFLIASAVLGNGIPAILFTVAQTRISSSVAGILNSLTPLFAMLVAVLIFKNKISTIHLFGVIIGFAGAVAILLFRSNGSIEIEYSYGAMIVIATAMYGASVNIIKNYLKEMPPLWISSFAISISGIPYGIYLFTTDFTERLALGGIAYKSFFYILLLGVVGTSISLILFNKLLKTTSVLFASSVTYLIPIVALMWGLLDHEDLGWMQTIGLFAILTGVYLVNRHKKPKV